MTLNSNQKSVIEFENVDVVFGSKNKEALEKLDLGLERSEVQEKTDCVVAVQNASLKVHSGEICVLMGLSGSGKSTLLRCVNGLNRPVRGKVKVRYSNDWIDTASCGNQDLKKIRGKTIAMVFQQFALLPWRTVADNVGFGLELQGVPLHTRKEVVQQQLQRVHLEKWADRQVHELSGGMQQRVGLARAFATDADILLMDEPFSALDPLIRTHLQDELLELQEQLGKTIIFVSHDLEEAVKLGTHIAILHEGSIVQYDTPEKIILQPNNNYVEEFVNHLNPLGVLRGLSVMTRLNQFDKNIESDWVRADGETLLKDLIKIRVESSNTVVLTENNQEVGVLQDDDIFRAILHQGRNLNG